MRYFAPTSMEEALGVLAARGPLILAGGTDVYPALRDRPLAADTMEISRIEGLRGISRRADVWRFGAATTWTDVVRADLPRAFDALKLAAREIGAIQIQNAGTIAGNICNASPAADGVPPLLALDASVELASAAGGRTVALADFITGVRRTDRRPDEMVTAITVPALPHHAMSGFAKLGSRSSLVISIAMVATVIVPSADGRIADARIAVGACSPVARRLSRLEHDLAGMPILADDVRAVPSPAHLDGLAPIGDVRAEAGYRLDAVLELVRRQLAALASQAAA